MSKIKVKFVGADIVIVKLNKEEKTAGGIIVPDSAQATGVNEGTVITADVETELEPGERVVFDAREAVMTKIQGEEVVVFRAEDALICVLEQQKYKPVANNKERRTQ